LRWPAGGGVFLGRLGHDSGWTINGFKLPKKFFLSSPNSLRNPHQQLEKA
jgi:hypothetical protein